MDLLARREHARAELVSKLRQRGFPADEIVTTLDRLEAEGLLSDERFAEAYVRQRAGKGFGPVRIRQELAQRGIDGPLSEAALAPWADRWLAIAAQQWEKRFGAPAEDARERARQIRHLQYRGFGFDIIQEIISD